MRNSALIDQLDRAVQIPSFANAWLFPIRTRIDMITTGIRTPVGVKVLGPKLETVEDIGLQTMKNIPEPVPAFRLTPEWSALQVPGWGSSWTQPIYNRINMVATGVRSMIGDPSIVKQSSHEYVHPSTDVRGAPGMEVWTFTALKPGTTTISTHYSSFVGKNSTPVCQYTAIVTVQ